MLHRSTPCRRASRCVLALLALLASACGDGAGSRGGRPDVVLIVVDTLRRDRMSCYGYERETSPFLEERARAGVLFEDVTAQSPWTLPSMVSMLHGRYLTAYRDALDPELPALAESFAAAGYRTLAIVSNCAVDAQSGFDRGFEHFDVVECWEDGEEKKVVRIRDIEEMRADLRAPLAAALAPDASGERPPLFLYLHSYDTHSPYHHHRDLDAVLPLAEAPPVEPPGWQEARLAAAGPPPPKGGFGAGLLELLRERGQYDQEVLHLDRGLRGLTEDLRAAGLAPDEAVWALVADHGECLWEHVAPFAPDVLAKSRPKTFFYQKHGALGCRGILDTPFLLWGAGVPAGRRIAAAVENVDLFPTLLELADIAPPRGLHGRSLVPLMRGERPEAWRDFTFAFGEHASSVRELASGLKLVVLGGKSAGSERALQLYDVANDPHERNDLGIERPAEVERLARVFREWIERYPTNSNLKVSDEKAAALRAELLRKLSALGYTEADTGLELGNVPGSDE